MIRVGVAQSQQTLRNMYGGVPFLSLNAAVQFVPMGDIVALSALCPIVAYVIARVVLKHQFTVLKVRLASEDKSGNIYHDYSRWIVK